MKIINFVWALVLFSSLVIAQGADGMHEPGTGLVQNASAGEGGLAIENLTEEMPIMLRLRARNGSELREMIQLRQRELNQTLQQVQSNIRPVYQNQNRVRLAVHSLLAMEDLVGGIGPQIREVATSFNNSVQATIRSEEKIQTRSGFARFFAGGDAEAAEELEQEVNRNQERIQTLKQLQEQCDCEEPVKTMMQEQIQNMEQEQNRLEQLSQAEKKSKGLLGWLWK